MEEVFAFVFAVAAISIFAIALARMVWDKLSGPLGLSFNGIVVSLMIIGIVLATVATVRVVRAEIVIPRRRRRQDRDFQAQQQRQQEAAKHEVVESQLRAERAQQLKKEQEQQALDAIAITPDGISNVAKRLVAELRKANS